MRDKGLLWEAEDLEGALGGTSSGENLSELACVLDSLLARASAFPQREEPQSLVESDTKALLEFQARLQRLKRSLGP
jgi:hypothetical protein